MAIHKSRSTFFLGLFVAIYSQLVCLCDCQSVLMPYFPVTYLRDPPSRTRPAYYPLSLESHSGVRISSRADYQELPQGTEVNTKFEDVALGRATVEISAKQNQVQKDCCTRIKVGFTKGHSNEAFKLHPYLFTYFRKEDFGLVNDRPHYTSEDGRFAIAFCGDSWWIQKQENRGECIGWAHSGWETDQCSDDIEYTWRYYIPELDTFAEARKGLSIWCKS